MISDLKRLGRRIKKRSLESSSLKVGKTLFEKSPFSSEIRWDFESKEGNQQSWGMNYFKNIG